MTVQARREKPIEHRRELVPQERTARHPLEVMPPAVVIWAVDAASGERPLEPPEYRLMADVHAEGHMRLASITAEVTLSDQKADEESELELGWHGRLPVVSPSCYTGNTGPCG
jgi:hypothetical protein